MTYLVERLGELRRHLANVLLARRRISGLELLTTDDCLRSVAATL